MIKEVLTISDNFTQLSKAVMDHISKLNRGKETKRAYARCFDGLGKYLQEQEVNYTDEAAATWLTAINKPTGKTEFALFKAAVNKLNDLYLYGEIQTGHYDQSKTTAGRLCTAFQAVLEHLLSSVSEKAPATVSRYRIGCANILLRFQSRGIYILSGITYEDLLDEFSSTAIETYYVRTAHHVNLRMLLQFLYEQGTVPYGYTLFVDGMTMQKGYFWNNVSTGQLAVLKESLLDNRSTLNLTDFQRLQNSLYQEHFQAGYSGTALTRLRRVTNLFLLFMDMNQLVYTPAVGCVWLESVKPFIITKEYKPFRRILCLLEQRFYDNPFPLKSYFVFNETAYDRLPDWCLPQVNEFLAMKKGEGLAHSTIEMYRGGICRFCISIDLMGIASFKSLTPQVVKQFNLIDKHRTPEGKNAYNSRNRKFLQFLGETGSLSSPFLFLALPCVCAARDSLVITLTEEEQKKLRNLFRSENPVLSQRKKAMIQLGLYMGIQGSDIISMTFDDIDWENASIRVLQDKTDYEVVLPMPLPVANALFRYIMYERPGADTRNVFVRKSAPFSPLGKGACRLALADALPERNVPGSGFHAARKTFATNLLQSDVPPRHIAEALGQRGLTNVHRYLSLEEGRMRMCGLGLHEGNLAMKEGFFHE